MEKSRISRKKFKKHIIVAKKSKSYANVGRIICPYCGNDEEFFEIAENVTITTRYVQNEDSSFTPLADDTEVLGGIRFKCGRCGADLTKYHKRFLEMLF